MRKAYPNHKMIPVGKPESDYLKEYEYGEDKMSFDSSKMVKALRRPMIGFEKSILNTAKVFERYL